MEPHLRPLGPADLDALERWLQPEQEWHRWDAPYFEKGDAAAVARYVDRLRTELGAPQPETVGEPAESLVITDGAAGGLLGQAGWHWEHRPGGWARAGLTVYDPAVRGRGVGTAALARLSDLVFTGTAAHRLDFVTWSGNTAMCRVGEKLGWVREATLREARVVRGERYDSVVYATLRTEWAARARVDATGEAG